MRLASIFPNTFTMCNLLCGCIGIMYAYRYPPYVAAYFLWCAACFDVLDGFVARIFSVSSLVGKQLDSLSDIVSFGVLPGMLAFTLVDVVSPYPWLAYIMLGVPVLSAWRLAKFNTDDSQNDTFHGLPTPANALFISGLVFLPWPLHAITSNAILLASLILLFSVLMITPFRFFSLKVKNLDGLCNKVYIAFFIGSFMCLLIKQEEVLSMVMVVYAILSLLGSVFSKRVKKKTSFADIIE